jgi:ADP-dependent phosphofructokinase/glucokinase
MRQIPVDARIKDWPRRVAEQGNKVAGLVSSMQSGAGGFSRAKARFLSGQ